MPTIHFCKVYYNSPYVRLLLRPDIPDCDMVVVNLTIYWEYDVFAHNDHVTSQMSFILQIMEDFYIESSTPRCPCFRCSYDCVSLGFHYAHPK